jgi:hAT family C-terminal dimerisation region
MARDHLAIPATSAPSEVVFSNSGDIITKKRSRLAPDTVRHIICLRDWGMFTEEETEELIIDLRQLE